jgi:hypothetical protein
MNKKTQTQKYMQKYLTGDQALSNTLSTMTNSPLPKVLEYITRFQA